MKARLIAPASVFFNRQAWDHAIETALDMTAENIRIDFQVTTRTWRGRPQFYIVDQGDQSRFIGTDSAIYRFVSRGTRVRYATMTKNFMPKTHVRAIASYKGRGGLAFVSRAHPRPGIKAREFEEVIGEKWTKRFPDQLQRSIRVEALRVGKP